MWNKVLPLALLLPLLVACGGGSGGGTESTATPEPAPPETPGPETGSDDEDDGSSEEEDDTVEVEDPLWRFTDVTTHSGLRHQWGIQGKVDNRGVTQAEFFGGGLAAGDFDGDGRVDVFVAGGNREPTKLYRNLGDNRFEDVAAGAGVKIENHRGSGPTFADVNGDGWLDLFVGGLEGDGNYLFLNNGDGTFSDFTANSGLRLNAVNTVSAAFGDYDLDGNLDLALSHWGNPFSTDTETLFRGTGTGRFDNVSVESGIAGQILTPGIAGIEGEKDYSFSPTFADLNNDGWPDLTMVSDFGSSKYFLNGGSESPGKFVHATDGQLTDEFGMGSAIGDYDNDGDLDWFVSSVYEFNDYAVTNIGNRLYINDGGRFSDGTFNARVENGGWGWAACLADVNNDGYLDIFHTNGWFESDGKEQGDNPQQKGANRLFVARGDGRFDEKAEELGVADFSQGRAVVCFDTDQDGDIDLLVASNEQAGNGLKLFRNDGDKGNFVAVQLTGSGTNTEAVGARIYLGAGGTTQMREIQVGSNFASQNPTQVIFGLGESERVTTVQVRWPDGSETADIPVTVNGRVEVKQGRSVSN